MGGKPPTIISIKMIENNTPKIVTYTSKYEKEGKGKKGKYVSAKHEITPETFNKIINIAKRAGFDALRDFSHRKRKDPDLSLMRDFPMASQIFAQKYSKAKKKEPVLVHTPVFRRFEFFLKKYESLEELGVQIAPKPKLATVGELWDMLNKLRGLYETCPKDCANVWIRLRLAVVRHLGETTTKAQAQNIKESARICKRTAHKELPLPDYLNPTQTSAENNKFWLNTLERCAQFLNKLSNL